MTWPKRAAMTMAMIALFAVASAASQWNERTTFKFDAPIMVPGATLAPGTYVFRVADDVTNQHMVQILKENGDLVTTTFTVPIKRMDSRGDTVIKLNPTVSGAPAALKAWYYPGTLYGHQFVYPDEQARQIAERTKTLVLSGDVPDSHMEKATLHLYDDRGAKQPWQRDEQTLGEWRQWTHHRATARVAAPGTSETRESTAPAVRTQPAGMKVPIDELEDDPKRYLGKTVNVTAEVEEVLGPRLFKIEEQLVYMPTDLVALIKEKDRVTVSGTVRMLAKTDLEAELDWLDADADTAIDVTTRPVLVATHVVGGNSDTALAIRVPVTPAPVGTAGGPVAARLTDARAIATGGVELVGRLVDLSNVKVHRLAAGRGFWIDAGGATVFVRPAPSTLATTVTAGQMLSVQGMVLEMPRSMRAMMGTATNAETDVYIYATTLK